jgi:VanZ family protein
MLLRERKGKKRAMNTTGNRGRTRVLSLICLSITIAILIAGLWPFNFRPKNQVTWLDGQNGIHFGRLGIAYSKDSVFGSREAIRPDRPVSIELAVRPGREFHYSVPRILTLYTEGNRQFFTLAQWKVDLILWADLRGNNLHLGSPEISARNVLLKNIPRFLTVTSQNGKTIIYADGQMINESNSFPILPTDSSASGTFVLGNSPTGKSPWTGDLLFLAAYDRELSEKEVLQHYKDWKARGTPTWLPGKTPALLYLFNERAGLTSRNHGDGGDHYDISIPATFYVHNKIVLASPWKEEFNLPFIHDVILNIFGFLPFGFFFAVWMRNGDGLPRKSHVFLITILGGGISLAIELLQTYLPTRTSSLSDVICNILGTILGVYLLRWILLFLRLEKRI